MQSDYKVQLSSPDLLPAKVLDEFVRLVVKGGEVNPSTLLGLVHGSAVVALVEHGGRLVAVAGVKRPHAAYRARVFAKAQVADPGRFPFELGWVFVQEGHRNRGLSLLLVSGLLQRMKDVSVYATSAADNFPMHATLTKAGFVAVGEQMPVVHPRQAPHPVRSGVRRVRCGIGFRGPSRTS